jgi:hypothetical protein
MRSPSARWLALLTLAACAHGPAPQSARIAQSCPALPARRAMARGTFPRAFIELASVKKGELPRSLSKLKQQPVEAQGVTGVVAEHEVPVPVSWDRCLDRKCELKLKRTLLVSAFLPSRASEPVRVEVMIREGTGEHASLYKEELETRDQQAAAVDEHAEGTMLVVTPYLLSSDADAQALIACKR